MPNFSQTEQSIRDLFFLCFKFNYDGIDYTVENEGFELKENGGCYAVKMDIDKKVPLVDLTDYYLKPEEFDTTVLNEGSTVEVLRFVGGG